MGTGKMDFLVSLWRFRAMRDTKKSIFPVPLGSQNTKSTSPNKTNALNYAFFFQAATLSSLLLPSFWSFLLSSQWERVAG